MPARPGHAARVGNSVRYAAAMSGPDYASFRNGWWSLTTNLQEMHEAIREQVRPAKSGR